MKTCSIVATQEPVSWEHDKNICQSNKHMQKNWESAPNYYVKLLIGLVGVYSDFLFNIWKKISIVLLTIFKETSLNHYFC